MNADVQSSSFFDADGLPGGGGWKAEESEPREVRLKGEEPIRDGLCTVLIDERIGTLLQAMKKTPFSLQARFSCTGNVLVCGFGSHLRSLIQKSSKFFGSCALLSQLLRTKPQCWRGRVFIISIHSRYAIYLPTMGWLTCGQCWHIFQAHPWSVWVYGTGDLLNDSAKPVSPHSTPVIPVGFNRVVQLLPDNR